MFLCSESVAAWLSREADRQRHGSRECSPEKTAPGGREMRDKAYRLCREFLSGSWKSISSSDMDFRTVSGGMSNLLYLCSLPATHTPLNGEPSQVLLRMYGQIHEAPSDSSITESVIFMLLSERKLGPRLYGIFPEGRLEEYIPARALTCEELRDPEISATIARKLARVHTLQVPINKEPTWLFDRMLRWLEYARTNIVLEKLDEVKRPKAQELLSVKWEEEIHWLRKALQKVPSPVVFCHNDLQEGNILFPEGHRSGEDKMVFIDFEYCSYNRRGFDLANHFCEWCFDYSNPDYPHYYANLENFPSESQQHHFLTSYLSHLPAQEETQSSEMNTVEHLLKEVQAFSLASHLLWALWSIYNANTSAIDFGYWEYGKTRFEAYQRCKFSLITSQKRKHSA